MRIDFKQQPAISLASWFNMQLQDRQTPAVRSPSSDSYVINVDEEMTTESSTQIRDETEHEHHHYHHTTMTDNYLNNIREATTSTSQSNNNNNNNNSEDDTSVTVPLSSETRDSLRSLFDICNKFLPFATILLVKFVYDHKSGLLQFSGLLLAFIYANKDLKREIAKQHNKSWKCLLSILIYIFACYFAVYFIFEEPLVRMYTVPTTMWELLWSVVMTDMVLKLGTVAMKVIVTCLPAKILPYQKRVSSECLFSKINMINVFILVKNFYKNCFFLSLRKIEPAFLGAFRCFFRIFSKQENIFMKCD